ncbi:hypothetical protein EK21DRAFT_94588 [Setomelanomma holmii]|uniref:Uncharacterized protein n=1 Tax=Setomelanomma holmii TaxID=210430 RepID=A0A9P4LGQ8_9PLEO|nr:hypothetical protein EK21DRAFT_94588 [Setomelanomma holmii]
MNINLLLQPQGKSPPSKASSASVTSNSTTATRAYTTAPSAYTQSPAHGASPAYTKGSPACVAPSSYGPNSTCLGQGTTWSRPLGPRPMLGRSVLPELERHSDPPCQSLCAGHLGQVDILYHPPGTNGSPPQAIKRRASKTPLPEESPAKKQSKWTLEEDILTIELRSQGMKWNDIAKRLPGRSFISCRLRYQNYLEKRTIWDDEKKNKLARLYARFKDQMWQNVATEMRITWRSAESMHWRLGEQEMSARANAPVFQPHPPVTGAKLGSSSRVPVVPAQAPHGFTAANASQLMPYPPPDPPQHHPPPPPIPQGPMHGFHQRTDSGSSQGRRRSSSFSRRRADPRSRASVPPQHTQPLPQIHAATAEDLVSGARTAPVPDHQGVNREREGFDHVGQHQNKRRFKEYPRPLRPSLVTRSQSFCAVKREMSSA